MIYRQILANRLVFFFFSRHFNAPAATRELKMGATGATATGLAEKAWN